MEIALIVVGGLIVLTVVALVGDYLTKTGVARSSVDPRVVGQWEKRLEALERKTQEQEAKLALLENDVAFTTKLLEGKK